MQDASAPAPPLPRGGRIARNIAALVLAGGLFAGTIGWQTDDTWPFAQMRMFPGGSESAVAITIIEAKLRNGRMREMNPFAFHLKRAEIEGQMDRIRADPQMLGDLIRTYNDTVAGPYEIVSIALIRRETVREDGRTRRLERELVGWPG
jgi:hypothetical protein